MVPNPFSKAPISSERQRKRAGEGTRTLDNHVGNVVLYQLSYTRNANVPFGGTRQNCNDSTVSQSASVSDLRKNGGFEKSCVLQNLPLDDKKEKAFNHQLSNHVRSGGELCLFSVSRQQIRSQIRMKSILNDDSGLPNRHVGLVQRPIPYIETSAESSRFCLKQF